MKVPLPFLALFLFCASSEATTCRLCPTGSEMRRPDKLIVGTEQASTCGAIETLLANIPTDSCEAALQELNSAPIDFREYCECTEYDNGPNFCSLCGNDEFVNSNETQPLLGGYTCVEYRDLASAAQTFEYCGTLRMGQHVCCEESKDATETCQVCSKGSDMLKPDRHVMLLSDNVTCQDYERELEVFAQHPYCDGLPGFDFASFCGCEGADPPSTCQFCEAGEITNPSLEVYIDGLDVWLTCEELALASAYTDDESLCDLLNTQSYKCCGIEAKVNPKQCRVCSTGAEMTLPERELVAHYDQSGRSLTCDSFDRYLANESTEVCQSIIAEEAIALPSYCGCSDAPSFPNVCKPLCPNGQEVIDPTAEVALNGVNVTCGQANLLNLYFFDEGLCAENFPILEASCCGIPLPSVDAKSLSNLSQDGPEDVDTNKAENEFRDAGSKKERFDSHNQAAKSSNSISEAESGDVVLSSSRKILWIVQFCALGLLLR